MDNQTKLNVILLQHTPNPEHTVALAARLCYSPADIGALKEKMSKSDVSGFIAKLMSLGHLSPFEHISFTFGIEGISRVTTHQLVRHRLASFSQQSQRYVTEQADVFPHIVPDSIKAVGEEDGFKDYMAAALAYYQKLIDLKVPAEDARYVLPNAAETKIIVTMNARELLHFFSVRCCERAQWEIRYMATQMLALVFEIAPVIFEQAGPTCVKGVCGEGAMSCGKFRDKFFFTDPAYLSAA